MISHVGWLSTASMLTRERSNGQAACQMRFEAEAGDQLRRFMTDCCVVVSSCSFLNFKEGAGVKLRGHTLRGLRLGFPGQMPVCQRARLRSKRHPGSGTTIIPFLTSLMLHLN